MKQILFVALIALLSISGLAFSQDVAYNYDQSADFAKYKSYKWVEIKGATHPDQLTDNQIRQALETELAKKGLTKVDNDSATLFIGYHVGVGQEKQINAYNMGGGPWGYGARWGGGMATATTSTINIGQLVLDMYDPASKQLVWRGTASKTIDPNIKPDKRAKNLAKGAEKLLKNYPPKKKS